MTSATLTSLFPTWSTLDLAGPLDDLEPLAEVIGDARVVAIGESLALPPLVGGIDQHSS